MPRIVVDDALCTKLCNLTQAVQVSNMERQVQGQWVPDVVELCDTAGHVLGCFLPYEDREPQISHEELQRRRQNKGNTLTTAEVLAHLETL